MAKRDTNNNDRDYVFANNENLEKQAELMQRMADDVLKRLETGYESIAARISSNYQKEYSKLEKAINDANNDREKRRNESSSFKENLYTNILNQTGAGQKFDTNWKSVGLTIGRELVQGIERAFSTYLLDPIKTGFSEMSATYEREFTEIAGRMGTNRSETYDTTKGAIDRLMATSAKWAVDINRDLIPALRDATKQGFTGDRAEEIALSNAIDKRIMPWLDTASDTWANLAFNLDKNAMQQIKGQQLLLQASESGNRLLQSGVINQLTTDIAPAIMNIDFNTGKDNLSPQYQAMMSALVDVGKMDPQQAYQMVQDVIKAQQNPAALFESGSYQDVMMAKAVIEGQDPIGVAQSAQYGYDLMASTGKLASFVGTNLGLNMGNGYYTDYNAENISKAWSAVEEYMNNPELAAAKYGTESENVAEKSTATESWDTFVRNQTTANMYWLNEYAHGPQMLENILTTLKEILLAVGGSIIGNHILNKLTGGGGGSGKGLLSKLGNAAKATKLGSSISGNLLSSSTGAVMGGGWLGSVALPAAAGAGLGYYGISQGVEDIKSGDTGYGVANIVGGGVAAAGGAIAAGTAATALLSAGAVNAWNPAGWVMLGVGAVTLATTAIVKKWEEATNQSGEALKGLSESISESTAIISAELESRSKLVDKIRSDIKYEDEQSAKESLLELGFSEEDLKGKTKEDYDLMLSQYQDTVESAKSAVETGASTLFSELSGTQEDTIENVIGEWGSKDSLLWNAAKQIEKDQGNAAMGKFLESIAIENKESIQRKLDSGTLSEEDTEKYKTELQHLEKNISNIQHRLKNGETIGEDYIGALTGMGLDNWSAFWATADQQSNLMPYLNIDDTLMAGYGDVFRDYGISDVTVGGETINATDAFSTIVTNEEAKKLSEIGGYRDALSIFAAKYAETGEDIYKKDMKEYLKKIRDFPYESPYKDPSLYTSYFEALGVDNWDSFRVGLSYNPHDRLAYIHQGEAVLTKQENEKRLEGLLPTQSLVESNKEAAQITANEVVNAIKSQTTEVLAALQQIINRLSSNQLTSIKRNDNESLRTMMPQIANTRNLT